jgi:hypothetical protein
MFFGTGQVGSAYKNAYVVLFNPNTVSVDLTGMSIQGQQLGTYPFSPTQSAALSGTIPASGYFLIKLASTDTNGLDLPAEDLSATSFSTERLSPWIALVKDTTTLSSCADSTVVDLLGWGLPGLPPACYEGWFYDVGAPTTNVGHSMRRINSCVDTGDNINDFQRNAPTPRNSSEPANPC